jgi:hypothetical protein
MNGGFGEMLPVLGLGGAWPQEGRRRGYGFWKMKLLCGAWLRGVDGLQQGSGHKHFARPSTLGCLQKKCSRKMSAEPPL